MCLHIQEEWEQPIETWFFFLHLEKFQLLGEFLGWNLSKAISIRIGQIKAGPSFIYLISGVIERRGKEKKVNRLLFKWFAINQKWCIWDKTNSKMNEHHLRLTNLRMFPTASIRQHQTVEIMRLSTVMIHQGREFTHVKFSMPIQIHRRSYCASA